MGAWGHKVFQNDTSLDIRDQYKALLKSGMSDEEISNIVVENNSELSCDEDEMGDFWLALAVSQWKVGRLNSAVKEEAVKCIENGVASEPYKDDQSLYKKRLKELKTVKDTLLSEQPERVTIKKGFFHRYSWPIGTVLAYRISESEYSIIVVCDYRYANGGEMAVFGVLDSSIGSIPNKEELKYLKLKCSTCDWMNTFGIKLIGVVTKRKKDFPATRLQKIGELNHNSFPLKSEKSCYHLFWDEFEDHVKLFTEEWNT
jgi:hypothetical protein